MVRRRSEDEAFLLDAPGLKKKRQRRGDRHPPCRGFRPPPCSSALPKQLRFNRQEASNDKKMQTLRQTTEGTFWPGSSKRGYCVKREGIYSRFFISSFIITTWSLLILQVLSWFRLSVWPDAGNVLLWSGISKSGETSH